MKYLFLREEKKFDTELMIWIEYKSATVLSRAISISQETKFDRYLMMRKKESYAVTGAPSEL